MTDWMNPAIFLQTTIRVLIVWLAFFGTGRLLRKPLRMDKAFPLLTSELLGMLVFVILAIPLSLLGIMDRAVCPILVLVMAVPGAFFTFDAIRAFPLKRFLSPFNSISLVIFIFVFLLNLSYASMPNMAFDDPLITYVVQPDRWLNRGSIYWLSETIFSGFPLFYEMSSVWPAALSSDRLNQLSVLQVFQLSMLVLAVFRGLQMLQVRRRLWLPVGVVVLSVTNIYYWCALAKPDTMALMFCTFALAAALRQKKTAFSHRSPLSAWLFMGLAMATKQTALLVFIPFILFNFREYLRYPLKFKLLSLIVLAVVPGAYGVRTLLATGSPFYPEMPVQTMLREEWRFRIPEEQGMLAQRTSEYYAHRHFSTAKHVGVFFAYMEGCVLLLFTGAVASAFLGQWRETLLMLLPIIVFFILAIMVFWPPWWGNKYALIIYPFAAMLGAKMAENLKHDRAVLSLVAVCSFVVPGFFAVAGNPYPVAYRITVLRSILQSHWDIDSGYGRWISTPEGIAHMWANQALPDDAVIFSLHEEKRYLFDGTVIVGWRHPLGIRMYLDNSLEDELMILDSLRVDYLSFYRYDPTVGEQENRLAILDHIGAGDILEPVIILEDGFALFRYIPRQ